MGIKKVKRQIMMRNPVVLWLLISFLVMAGVIGVIACNFAYQQKRGEILSKLDIQLLQVANEYKDITEDFWAIYLPIFEETEDNDCLNNYFEEGEAGELSPMEKFELSKTLSHMAVRDESVQWIAVYSPERKVNYIYFSLGSSLQTLPEDFPYMDELAEKRIQMEVYPKEEVNVGEHHYQSIAIAGGTPGKMQSGSILVGYAVNQLEQLCKTQDGLETLRFDIFRNGRVVFSSGKWMDWPTEEYEIGQSAIYEVGGEKWHVQVFDETLRGERICYAIKWSELFQNAIQSAVGILGITLLMATLAVAVCLTTLTSLTKEVNVIRHGLDILGKNQLSHRIEDKFNQPELASIAEAINQMSQSLQENIERTHEYEQRQIKSELQELQAKFNPHFLYNTLEIFRARCYQNGDEETADLIAQTAAIFRGFIGSRSFIPMQEELAFGKRYLALFRARYGESVKVMYDIDTEVLQYGIIRNVFQPLIENYFEHGYNPDNEENYILFRGRIRDEDTILFSIEDNGFGMEEAKLQALNEQLQHPIASEKESYGLRNLHQRLRLFYGDGCGLTLCSKEEPGLVIEMIIKRQKCEETV